MSEERFTQVTQTSWGGRIKSSLKGILFGLLFFFEQAARLGHQRAMNLIFSQKIDW